jgi:hypothetical protein
MRVQISESDFICVRDRTGELGCYLPNGLAVMPENFMMAASRLELLVRAESATLRELFENTKTPLGSFFPLGEHPTFGRDNNINWEASLFISADLIRNDPSAVALAMTRITEYLSAFFCGHAGKKIRLNLVVERGRDRSCKRLTYEGEVGGLLALADGVGKIADG